MGVCRRPLLLCKRKHNRHKLCKLLRGDFWRFTDCNFGGPFLVKVFKAKDKCLCSAHVCLFLLLAVEELDSTAYSKTNSDLKLDCLPVGSGKQGIVAGHMETPSIPQSDIE